MLLEWQVLTLLYYLFCTFRWWELLLCLEVFLLTRILKQHQTLSCGGTGEHFGQQMLEVHGVMRSGYSCGWARTGCRPLKCTLYRWVIREFASLSCSRHTTLPGWVTSWWTMIVRLFLGGYELVFFIMACTDGICVYKHLVCWLIRSPFNSKSYLPMSCHLQVFAGNVVCSDFPYAHGPPMILCIHYEFGFLSSSMAAILVLCVCRTPTTRA